MSVPSYRVHYTCYQFAQIPLNYLNVISHNPFKMSFSFQIAISTIGTINLVAILQTSLHNYKASLVDAYHCRYMTQSVNDDEYFATIVSLG